MTFQETIKTLGEINQRIYGINPYAEVAVSEPEKLKPNNKPLIQEGEKVEREELQAE